MKHKITVQNSLIVEIVSIFQCWMPGLFDGCTTTEEFMLRSKSEQYLFKNEKAGERLFIIQPSIDLKGSDVFACKALLSYTDSGTMGSLGYDYNLHVLWFQNEFAFPIAVDVLNKLRLLDFKREAVKSELPF